MLRVLEEESFSPSDRRQAREPLKRLRATAEPGPTHPPLTRNCPFWVRRCGKPAAMMFLEANQGG
jgi:hypothetical protein